MNPEKLFQNWADDSVWSPWIKPVLFAHLSSAIIERISSDTSDETVPVDVGHMPRATGTTAVLVDLPGAASIATGLALAELGYRPIPLYNSVPVLLPGNSTPVTAPFPEATPRSEQETPGTPVSPVFRDDRSVSRAAIDMYPIVRLLVQGAENDSLKRLSPQAPPAFLLDSRRRGVGTVCRPGDFDNRSISLPTDFPSDNFLLANHIRDAIVFQEQPGTPQYDLGHTLRRWQDGGIRIMTAVPGDNPQVVLVPPPPRFRHMWYGLLARMGLRQNPLGGFGGFLPLPSAG